MLGYQFDTNEKAQIALQDCKKFYAGTHFDDKYFVKEELTQNHIPVFWYIEFRAYLFPVLGMPTEFEISG